MMACMSHMSGKRSRDVWLTAPHAPATAAAPWRVMLNQSAPEPGARVAD